MRNYELTLILSPEKSESETNDMFQNLVAFIQDKGGILEKQNITPKRDLGVPIQKKEQGVLATLSFNVAQENLPEIEKKLKENTDVLRYMISKKSPIRVMKKRAKRIETTTLSTISQAKKEPKAEVKDIDKKLEEIFKE